MIFKGWLTNYPQWVCHLMMSCRLCCYLALYRKVGILLLCHLVILLPKENCLWIWSKLPCCMRRQEEKTWGFNHSEANVVFYSKWGRAKNKDFPHNRDKSKGRSKSKFKGKIICHYYHNPSHIKKFSRKKKRRKSQERKEKMKTWTSEHQQQTYGKPTLALAVVVMMYLSFVSRVV